MKTELTSPVTYRLPLSDQQVDLNPLIGQKLTLRHSGQIFCVHCNRKTNKSFNQGYCYPCFTTLAQCDLCIMKPETCHYDKGTCREPVWGEKHCFQPHYVYLANSSGVKVGITRQTQIPTRWIDQGAVQALPVFKVQSRYISGLVEVIIANHVSDKTSWQRMLKNQVEPLDLAAIRDELLIECESDLADISRRFGDHAIAYQADADQIDIEFPVAVYPTKVKSFNFDKQGEVSGVLQGIKGQYLIFDNGVINIRKFAGYEVELQV
ncbi:DUF2797 domain-containing protein [Methylomarinum sp. Ch1-1]|uniref:DUF2797 domain-containing protein n=1 Tax=Methylomarinum roseum TaxID=3067653 RepID=A0AAU7NZB9_9GAMM|nr:DUF2797 domain-containing protein [Methylomarinum sp. Ch1-1]MDP4521646.1 DUF2797 domain-containing protein [Methylomarinum sp. Ch1-1]